MGESEPKDVFETEQLGKSSTHSGFMGSLHLFRDSLQAFLGISQVYEA